MEYLIQDTTLQDIADAIRSKTGGTAQIAVPDMAAQISGIQTKQDLSFVTAGKEQILSGYVGADKDGQPVIGGLVPSKVYFTEGVVSNGYSTSTNLTKPISTYTMPGFTPDLIFMFQMGELNSNNYNAPFLKCIFADYIHSVGIMMDYGTGYWYQNYGYDSSSNIYTFADFEYATKPSGDTIALQNNGGYVGNVAIYNTTSFLIAVKI